MFPLKTTGRKSKPGWEHIFVSQKKRLRQQTRILKRNIKNIFDEIEEAGLLELKKRKPTKNTSERRKTKKIPRQDQTMFTKQAVPKQGKNILPTIKERMSESISANACDRDKKILEQNMGTEYS